MDKELAKKHRQEAMARARAAKDAKKNRRGAVSEPEIVASATTSHKQANGVADPIRAAEQTVTPPAVVPQRVKRPISNLFGLKKKPNPAVEDSSVVDKAAVLESRKGFDANTLRLAGGIVAIIAGILMVWLWFAVMPKSPVPAIPALAAFIGGGWLIKEYFNKRGQSGEAVVVEPTATTVSNKLANTLSIYPDRVVFEYVENPQGQPWKCHNNSKLYFIRIESSAFTPNKPSADKSTWTMKPFVLPDQRYYDPGVFATRVLELPAHRRIFRRKQSMLEQLSPALVILAVGIFAIVMVVTLG